jgi:hypothetical protein
LYAFTVAILVIITISFIGSPVLSRIQGRARLVFGSYDGEDIEFVRGNYMATQYDLIAERIRSSGQSGSLETQLYQAWRYAFNQTVLHTAILQEMDRSGAWVSDDRVADSLVEYGPYVVGGVFDQARYSATPQSERVSIRRLRREELLHDRYLMDLFATDKMSEAETQFLLSMASPERRFSFVTYQFSELPDSMIVDYGLANRERFQRRKLSRITITASEREAEQVRQRALAGEASFDELARSFSKGFYADKGGDMGWQYYYDLEVFFDNIEAVDEVFVLEDGEISEVLESAGSWVFFRADSAVVQADLEDQEVLDRIRDYILTNEVGVAEEYFLEEAARLAASAREVGFDGAVLDAGVSPVYRTEWVPINYGSIFYSKRLRVVGDDQNVIGAATRDEDIFRTAFSLGIDEVSDPLLIGDRVVVMTVTGERETPAEDVQAAGDSLESLDLRVLENDLPDYLVHDDLLVDNFQDTFFTTILGNPQ